MATHQEMDAHKNKSDAYKNKLSAHKNKLNGYSFDGGWAFVWKWAVIRFFTSSPTLPDVSGQVLQRRGE